jgi:hypothetical protein
MSSLTERLKKYFRSQICMNINDQSSLVRYVITVTKLVTIVGDKVFSEHDVLIVQLVNGHKHKSL